MFRECRVWKPDFWHSNTTTFTSAWPRREPAETSSQLETADVSSLTTTGQHGRFAAISHSLPPHDHNLLWRSTRTAGVHLVISVANKMHLSKESRTWRTPHLRQAYLVFGSVLCNSLTHSPTTRTGYATAGPGLWTMLCAGVEV